MKNNKVTATHIKKAVEVFAQCLSMIEGKTVAESRADLCWTLFMPLSKDVQRPDFRACATGRKLIKSLNEAPPARAHSGA